MMTDSAATALLAARVRAAQTLAATREFDLEVKRRRYVDRLAVEDALAHLAKRCAPQLAIALNVARDDAFAALIGIGARIAAEAGLGGLMGFEPEDDLGEP